MNTKLRSWTEAVLQRPLYAAGFALLCTVIPFAEWVAWAVLVLTTLRYGLRYSASVLSAIAVGVVLFVGVLNGMMGMAVIHVVLLVIPIWIFSLVLRYSVSLNYTLQMMALAILLVILLVGYAGYNNPLVISDYLLQRMQDITATVPMDVQQNIRAFAEFFVLYWPTSLFITYMFALFLGRWWQAALDNPGGFKREFHALRMHYSVGGAALVLMLLSFWQPDNVSLLAACILAATLLSIAALGLIHCWVETKQWSNWFLVGIYVGGFFLSVFIVPLMVVLAAVDSAADLRKYLNKR